MHTSHHSSATIKATFIGVLAPFLWSTYPTLTYFIGAMPPFQLLTIGFSISFLFSVTIWLWRGTSIRTLMAQPPKYWFIGTFGILGFNSFYILALTHAPKAEAFLLTSIWPFIALFIGTIFLKEPLRIYHILGCAMGLIGIFFIALNRDIGALELSHLWGYFACIVAAFIWAIYSLTLRANPFPKPEFIGMISAPAAIGSFCLHLSLEQWTPIHSSQFLPLFLIGIGSLGLSYYCWNYGVKNGDLRALNNLVYLGHFSTIALLMMVGQASLTLYLICAFVFIIGGALVGSSGLFLRKKH